MPEQSMPLPPATFEFLVFSFKMQAEMQLGLIHFGGEEGPPEPDFAAARHAIDLLAMLEEKTRNNLTTDEARLLENSLTELRFRYVQALEAGAKKPEAKAETTDTQQAGA
jgi:hypothetical protein